MSNAVSAISKYHIIGDSGPRKYFWQSKPPLPKYCGTWDMKIVLRFLEDLGENDSLSLKQLSEKTAFLIVFSTMARC